MKQTIGLMIAGVLMAIPASAQQLSSARVVSVGDGDTIRVERQNRTITVRLGCIDAPELAQQPWGSRARDRLRQILPAGQSVQLREIELDRFGRTVAEVYKANQSVNLQLVREGYAVVYREYLDGCAATRNQYLQSETTAKQRRLAFWSQANPTLPWDFRRGGSTSTTRPSASPAPVSATPLRAPVTGSCECPYDFDSRGGRCGGRSAYSRPGGASPRCYVGE